MHIAVSHRLLPFPPDQLHLMILLLLLLRTFRPRCKSIFSFLSSMMSNSSLLPCFWACHVHGKHFKAPPFPSSKYCLCSLGTLLLREPITHPHRLRLPPSPTSGDASAELVMHLFLPVLLVLVEAMQQVLQHVVQEVIEVLLGEVLQLVLLELLAWRGREG